MVLFVYRTLSGVVWFCLKVASFTTFGTPFLAAIQTCARFVMKFTTLRDAAY